MLLATLVATDLAELIPQRDLAILAGTDNMMTSNVLRALEAKSLISRAPHPIDARAIALAPTSAGITLVRTANEAVENADDAFFAVLTDDQRAHLLVALHSLRAGTAADSAGSTSSPATTGDLGGAGGGLRRGPGRLRGQPTRAWRT